MKFELSPKEIEDAYKFYKSCKRKTKGEDVRISYIFHPTGIGNNVRIRSETLKIEKDITDYENW